MRNQTFLYVWIAIPLDEPVREKGDQTKRIVIAFGLCVCTISNTDCH